jgi:hypothetical protein
MLPANRRRMDKQIIGTAAADRRCLGGVGHEIVFQ